MFVDMTDMVLVGLCCVCWYDWTWCWWVCVVFVDMTDMVLVGLCCVC